MLNFVSSTIPRHLSEDIPVDQKIEIFFFIDVNKGTIEADKVILFNLTEERSEDISFEYRNRHLIIKPMNELMPNMHYQVQLIGGRNGLKDIVGRPLVETYVFEFYTKKTKTLQPPLLLSPTNLVEVKDDVLFEWRASIGASHYELEISRSNTFQHLVWPEVPTPVYQTSITPHINYEPGTYYVRIRSVNPQGEKSNYSKPIRYHYNGPKQHESETVKTNQSPVIEANGKSMNKPSQISVLQQHFLEEEQSKESNKFAVVSSTPKHKALNLSSHGDKITIHFNQNVDPKSITPESIYIIKEKN